VSARSAEERDGPVVDGGQRDGRQSGAVEDHQRLGLQRHSADQRPVLLHFTAVARVDLDALRTRDTHRCSCLSGVGDFNYPTNHGWAGGAADTVLADLKLSSELPAKSQNPSLTHYKALQRRCERIA